METRSRSAERMSSKVEERKLEPALSSLHDGTKLLSPLTTRSGAENHNSVEPLSVSPKIARGSTLTSANSPSPGIKRDESLADMIRLLQRVGISDNKRYSHAEKEANAYTGPVAGSFGIADVPSYLFHFDSIMDRYPEVDGEDVSKIAFSKLPTALKLRQDIRAAKTWSELRKVVMSAMNFNIDLELESVS